LGRETLFPELPLDDLGLLIRPELFDLFELRDLFTDELLLDDLLLRRTEGLDFRELLLERFIELWLLFVLRVEIFFLERSLLPVVVALPSSFDRLSRRMRLEDVPLVLFSLLLFVLVAICPVRAVLVAGVTAVAPLVLFRSLSTYRRGSTVLRFTGTVRAETYCPP
jgi:hypothetical protein